LKSIRELCSSQRDAKSKPTARAKQNTNVANSVKTRRTSRRNRDLGLQADCIGPKALLDIIKGRPFAAGFDRSRHLTYNKERPHEADGAGYIDLTAEGMTIPFGRSSSQSAARKTSTGG